MRNKFENLVQNIEFWQQMHKAALTEQEYLQAMIALVNMYDYMFELYTIDCIWS